ncbi:hypothetical protein K1719_037308 [Acacia pycnantha]|nr:hypothetical protein K1719_037308 [Acacia pycnantha]
MIFFPPETSVLRFQELHSIMAKGLKYLLLYPFITLMLGLYAVPSFLNKLDTTFLAHLSEDVKKLRTVSFFHDRWIHSFNDI